MENNIFDIIEEKLPGLSKGKQQIATYILQNPNEAAFQTAAQIGKTVKISESSVVRFAGDLGFKGYPEFQKTLQHVVKSRLQTGNTSSKTSNPVDCGEFSDSDIAYFAQPLSLSHTVCILATPIGQLLVPYCKLGVELIGNTSIIPSATSEDELFRYLGQITPGDLVLFFRLGTIPAIQRFALEQARHMGAQILLITDNPSEDITTLADRVLVLPNISCSDLPDISRGLSLLHRVFSLLMEERGNTITKQKKVIEEIRNVYNNYGKSVL